MSQPRSYIFPGSDRRPATTDLPPSLNTALALILLGVGFLLSPGADGRKPLLTDLARSSRLHLPRIGPLERVRDDGGPRGGRDAPGPVPDELRGKTQRAVEFPAPFRATEESFQLSPALKDRQSPPPDGKRRPERAGWPTKMPA